MRKISIVYEEKQVIIHEVEAKMLHLLHEVLTETIAAQLIMLSLPLTQVHAALRRH